MPEFRYGVSRFAPCGDRDVCEEIRGIDRADICRHPNPDFHIRVVKEEEIASMRIRDIFGRIKASDDEDKRLVMILPQPHPQYVKVAELINRHRVNCRNLYTFNMDEWADEDGNVAPETYPNGFMYAMLNNFYSRIDEDLRPPLEQIQGINNDNLDDYGKMMEDLGGVDLCDGGIGWSGHVAFVEPGAPEFAAAGLEEWKALGPYERGLGQYPAESGDHRSRAGAGRAVAQLVEPFHTRRHERVLAAIHRAAGRARPRRSSLPCVHPSGRPD